MTKVHPLAILAFAVTPHVPTLNGYLYPDRWHPTIIPNRMLLCVTKRVSGRASSGCQSLNLPFMRRTGLAQSASYRTSRALS